MSDDGNVPFEPLKVNVIDRRYDATISFYDIRGRDLARLREVVLSLLPATVDISFSSDEKTQTNESPSYTAAQASEDLFYDDDTLRKVYEAIDDAGSMVSTQEIVSALQNRGILFRERSHG